MVRTILMRLQGAVQRLRVVDQVEIAVPQAELHVLHAAPLVGVRQQRLAQERQLRRRRWSARRSASCRSVPSTPIRSPRSSSWASSQPCSPTCFWPSITWMRLDRSGTFSTSASRSPLISRERRLAGPVLDVEEMDLAAVAAADDAAGDAQRAAVGLPARRSAGRGRPRSADGRRNGRPTDRGRAPRWRCSLSVRLASKVSWGSVTVVRLSC